MQDLHRSGLSVAIAEDWPMMGVQASWELNLLLPAPVRAFSWQSTRIHAISLLQWRTMQP